MTRTLLGSSFVFVTNMCQPRGCQPGTVPPASVVGPDWETETSRAGTVKPPPVTLSAGPVVCGRCKMPAGVYIAGDDGRCDVCERSTRKFTEHFFSAAATTFPFNACDACARFVARLPATTQPRT